MSFRLFDGETSEYLGTATQEQVEASFAPNNPEGFILIDSATGEVLRPWTPAYGFAFREHGVRKVFVDD